MELPRLQELEAAASAIYTRMPPTPQYVWPQICELLGATVWIKHENHTPAGAFKVRGGITFIDWLRRAHPQCREIVAATRGNHGQSLARAAGMAGLRATIVVPVGNSREKNAAMRAFGAELVESGADFDAAHGEAQRIAQQRGAFIVPPFHRQLVLGVASCGLELLRAAPALDTVYVPIGCGSGICGLIAAREALGLRTEIVGVVAAQADAARRSFEAGRIIETDTAHTFADGLAVLHQVKINRAWHGLWMPKLLQGFEDGAIEIPQDDNCAADLRCIEEVDGVPMVSKLRRKDLKDPELVRHGDFASMLELGWFASLNMSAPIEFTAMPVHPRGFDNVTHTEAARMQRRADEWLEDIHLPEQAGW